MFSRCGVCIALSVMTMTFASAASPDNTTEEVILSLKKEGQFPGVVVGVFRDGKLVFSGAYGEAVIEHDIAATANTVFELASLTKHMTALAVLTLAEDDKLSLSDSIADYVDDAPEAWRPITIGHLLNHTGGLSHHFEAKLDGEFAVEYSTEAMLDAAKKTPLLSEPGTDWNYSDQGYFLLGVVIEKVTGQSFSDYMQATFFKPLGMDQTRPLDQHAVISHRAEGYAFKEGEIKRNRRVWQFGLTSHFGVMSSLDDMATWEAELADPQVIDPDALAALWPIQRPFHTGENCDAWGYARGWTSMVKNGKRIATHGGYSGTAICAL